MDFVKAIVLFVALFLSLVIWWATMTEHHDQSVEDTDMPGFRAFIIALTSLMWALFYYLSI